MKLEGKEEFEHPPVEVWLALHDVDLLARAIPGCRGMIATGPDEYRVTLALGVAAVKGEYEGTVWVDDIAFPTCYKIRAEGSGKPGYVRSEMDCHLAPAEQGTAMTWSCDAEVGGIIAGVGGRVLTGISKHMAKQFFKTFKQGLQARVETRGADAAPGGAA